MTNTVSTIASIGVSPIPINVFLVSDSEPTTRDNGGDLVQGDRWFNKSNTTESVFVDGAWVALTHTHK